MQATPNNKKSPFIGIAVVLILVGLIVALIVLTKGSTTKTFDEEGQLIQNDTLDIAHPSIDDTDPEYELSAIVPDTLMGTDGRDLSDAGFEDGYWAGYDDARLGQEHASYDESYSGAASQKERSLYAKNYKEGYSEGWTSGINDRNAIDQKAEDYKMPERAESKGK